MSTGGAYGAPNPERTTASITGLGAVSGYGWGEKRLREGLFAGRSAVRRIQGYLPDSPEQSVWLALVDDEFGSSATPDRPARAIRFAVREALSDAVDRGWRAGDAGLIYAGEDGEATCAQLVRDLDLPGPRMCVSAGSASGALALLTAMCWVEGRVADDVVVVCSDVSAEPGRLLRPSDTDVLDAPATEACRPFQQGSRGANPGEAVIAVVVSGTPGSAYARLLGGTAVRAGHGGRDRQQEPRSASADSPVQQALARALDHAAVGPGDVAYLNAYGCGVPELDALESEAADHLLGTKWGLYSLKPLVGDCRTASGAIETVGALYGFTTGVVPAPSRRAPGHPHLLDGATAASDGVVAKSSIGSDGEGAVLLLGPPRS